MDIRIQGSGGVLGWPEPGCRCASCLRARSAGISRAPSRVIVDGTVALGGRTPGWAGGTRREPTGHQVTRLPGGWEITAPDGARLFCAVPGGAAPAVPPGTAPYDMALLDLLGDPAGLGRLRADGVVTSATVVAALFADHRVISERELARRCRIWRAVLPRDGDSFSVPAPDAETAAAPWPHPFRVLVLGGARSGKSEEAEMRVAAEPSVTYVATGPAALDTTGRDSGGAGDGGDAEWAARIAAHRARRPQWWRTVESTDLAGALRQTRGAILVDSMTTWLAAAMDECGVWAGSPAAAELLEARIAELRMAWRQASAYVVAVSDETGLGIVPETPSGRMFRDELGRLNQHLAAESDEVTFVVAGRALTLPD
ncbi:MAG TPA: bifunctional adenosylcobinamide kinase/adenosylcobinamide-phosphate guanylyltransferase [Streptosporangiaceae bacterium]|jgi:adenosylcobinamide kinase/adenosylcobinamide-phosphate guanylyltransferase|nr:bifunctional adenosylcobinamide kinase/adenosylcobinamide-phosphate guanylyltransferase [Streptosporangiaceae bacterium]